MLNIAEVPKWKRDYFTACNKVILAETLSPTFVGLQFRQVRIQGDRGGQYVLLAFFLQLFNLAQLHAPPFLPYSSISGLEVEQLKRSTKPRVGPP